MTFRHKSLMVVASALLWAVAHSGWAQTTPPVPRERPEGLGSVVSDQPAEQTIDLENPEVASGAETETIAEPPAPPAGGAEQPVTLIARITEGGAIIPAGISWRVFNTIPNASGQVDLVARSDDATAVIGLAPGEYAVHVAYGNAQISETMQVQVGPNEKTLILDAGALKLDSAVTGDIEINTSALRYDVFTTDAENNRAAIVRDVRAGDLVYLNAGVYNVESKWGGINATVRADLRVEPGQVTEATLFHRASMINLRLVSTPGGEAIADVEWSVRDPAGAELFSHFGAFPSLVLAEGEYTVIAKLGSNVFNKDFQVLPGPAQEIEVLTTLY